MPELTSERSALSGAASSAGCTEPPEKLNAFTSRCGASWASSAAGRPTTPSCGQSWSSVTGGILERIDTSVSAPEPGRLGARRRRRATRPAVASILATQTRTRGSKRRRTRRCRVRGYAFGRGSSSRSLDVGLARTRLGLLEHQYGILPDWRDAAAAGLVGRPKRSSSSSPQRESTPTKRTDRPRRRRRGRRGARDRGRRSPTPSPRSALAVRAPSGVQAALGAECPRRTRRRGERPGGLPALRRHARGDAAFVEQRRPVYRGPESALGRTLGIPSEDGALPGPVGRRSRARSASRG